MWVFGSVNILVICKILYKPFIVTQKIWPCKVTTLKIEVNMYIEDNAADKMEKVGEEGKINSFMNIVDWEKLVKYLSTIKV